MATNYDVNYDDKRFEQVESDKAEAMDDLNQTYDGMVNQTDKYFQDQINASKKWESVQSENQQAQTDFAIEKIEQQKDQAHKDYIKEQSGAYTDWQKQSAQHGVNAEQMAAQGMQTTGYSESSRVAMYNTYQNRVTAAREVYSRAVLNYDNAIKEARLQNNSILAEIAYNSFKEQLELSLKGLQYKNQLILEKSNKKLELDNMYYGRWKDVLNQINTENALAEETRQFDESLAEDARQFDESLALQNGGFGPIENDEGTKEKTEEEILGEKNTEANIGAIVNPSIGNVVTKVESNREIINKIPENGFGWPGQAYEFLEKYGIDRGDAGVLTQYDWAMEKQKGNTGKAFQYSTYREYLTAWVVWMIVNG